MSESVFLSGEAPQFPMERTHPFDPAPAYRAARETGALTRIRMWDGALAWLATRYDDVRQVLTDPRFSQVPTRPGYPFPSRNRATMLTTERPPLNQLDPPEHTRIRRMFTGTFSVKRIEQLRPRVQQMVDQLIDDMLDAGPPADFCDRFAGLLPAWAIAELLGVPPHDHALFQETAYARFSHVGDPNRGVVAGEKMREYLGELIADKARQPDDGRDVINRLAVEQIRPGHLSLDDATVHVRQLLLAGHDTTANMLALGLLALFENPEQFALLRSDPGLVPNAVEEMLRYWTIAQFNSSRVALEDVEVGGQVVREGEGVVASLAAANRDPDAFSDPDKFDIRRDPEGHIAFAYGVHQCLGQPLARLELQVVFTTLLTRIPTLRLAIRLDEVEFTGNGAQAYGVRALPVAW